MFAKYISADGCFVKTILLTGIITTMQPNLMMNLYIAPRETSFCKLWRPCKNSLSLKDCAIAQSYANHFARIIEQHFAE